MTPMKMPGSRVQLQLIVFLGDRGDRTAAMAEANRITDKLVAAEAWRLLSDLNANMQRRSEALPGLEIALQHQPDSRPLRLRRKLLPEQSGDSRESLAELEVFVREAVDSPGLLVHLGRALRHAGETERAETNIAAALQRSPSNVSPHKLLAVTSPRLARPAGAVAAWRHPVQSQPSRG
jgi:Flp pilus assembly protein TadD